MTNSHPSLSYERSLEVRHEPDVLVVGGGPAGVAAAMAAQGEQDTRRIDIGDLQKRLKALGAYLPHGGAA